MSATLYAELIQAPSSTPRPTVPLRSARPSVIIRPVSVTIPAPRTTPRIPITGRFESSDGSPPAIVLAICAFVGGASEPATVAIGGSAHCFVRTVAVTESPGRSCAERGVGSRAILTGILCTTLVKFPVALSGGSSANCEPLAGAIARTLPPNFCPRCVLTVLSAVAHLDVSELRFAIVRLNPLEVGNECQNLRARRHQLPWAHLPLANRPVSRRGDLRVSQIHLSYFERSLFGMQVGDELGFLGLEY